jgi:hypothetical protein
MTSPRGAGARWAVPCCAALCQYVCCHAVPPVPCLDVLSMMLHAVLCWSAPSMPLDFFP